jgi:hypothetical protein
VKPNLRIVSDGYSLSPATKVLDEIDNPVDDCIEGLKLSLELTVMKPEAECVITQYLGERGSVSFRYRVKHLELKLELIEKPEAP